MPNLRSDSFRIHVHVDGVNSPSIKSWQGLNGGDATSEDTKTRPGGQEPQVSLGGPPTRSDATATRLHTSELQKYIVQWENHINSGMWISYTPIDSNRAQLGPTITLHGFLKGVTQNEKDADNQGKKTVSLVMSCNYESSISQ